MKKNILIILVGLFIVTAYVTVLFKNQPPHKYVFDSVGIFENIEEYSNKYIKENLVNKYSIEAVIVTLHDLQGQASIEEPRNR